MDSKFRSLAEIEEKLCELTARFVSMQREEVHQTSRFIEDLGFDSLYVVELFAEIEDHFDVTISRRDRDNSVTKAIFARKDLRVRDLAEIVYVQQGTGKPPPRDRWKRRSKQLKAEQASPFAQLSGRWEDDIFIPLFERLDVQSPFQMLRRRSDGMRCVVIPAATVQIGTNSKLYDHDATPQHTVELDSFLIDAETVSTTAYCRFLNTIGDVDQSVLADWFVLQDRDSRNEHHLIKQTESGWQPIQGCEKWPMILVSWYGANAYSLWANRYDWQRYRVDQEGERTCFLPTEAQWEYAARGAQFQDYPWGADAILEEQMCFGKHALGATYDAETPPMQPVNSELGMSPFGLHHMAGNVWQWCADWYAPDFYSWPESQAKNAVNRLATGIRSERGGSWVGPAELCRSSHRRGREPSAKGRCLGFRCISDIGHAK